MVDVEGYFMEFTQKMTFTAHSPSRSHRHEKRTLVKRNYPEICRRLTNRILNGEFQIPSVPPTTDPTKIIYVEYRLKVTMIMSGCHRSKDISVPIFIGNIPLRESLSSIAGGMDVTPSAPEMTKSEDNSGSEMPPNYNDLSKYLEIIL